MSRVKRKASCISFDDHLDDSNKYLKASSTGYVQFQASELPQPQRPLQSMDASGDVVTTPNKRDKNVSRRALALVRPRQTNGLFYKIDNPTAVRQLWGDQYKAITNSPLPQSTYHGKIASASDKQSPSLLLLPTGPPLHLFQLLTQLYPEVTAALADLQITN